MTLTDWVAFLSGPKAILGPYKGKAPPLATFASHSWRATFDFVSIAGPFMQLPEEVPLSWETRNKRVRMRCSLSGRFACFTLTEF